MNDKKTTVTIKRLLSYLKSHTLTIILTVIVAIVGTVMQVLTPKLLGNATTLIFDGLMSGMGIDYNQLFSKLAIVTAMIIGICIATFLQQRIMLVVSQKTTFTLRNELRAKMNRVPISYFDKTGNGNLMSIASNDVDNIVNNLQQSLTEIISSSILFVGILWIMISINGLLTLVAALLIPCSLIIMKVLTPNTKLNNQAYFKSMGQLNSQIEETYNGFTVIKSNNCEGEMKKTFGAINENMYQSGWKARFYGGLMMPSLSMVQNVIYVLIAVIGSIKIISGTITIGNIQAFLQYSNLFSQTPMKFAMSWGNILSMIASAERIFDLLDAEEMDEELSDFTDLVNNTSKVSFESVKFGYDQSPLLDDFSLEVDQGQMVAIVGHTGAGKTTLINLLERFYEIEAGHIRIDGRDIRNSKRTDLRKKIGMVLQDTWLFSGTIFDNIKYGNENATDDEVYAAAKAAFADEFIHKLPDGYQTIINEESSNLSLGQQQLITIARAFITNPEILILDEATSNVDSRTELIIQSAMKRLLKGRTSFVIAHRLSTIYEADKILVMEKGNIVETGTHTNLIESKGVYADIYNSQFAQNVA
ncbi:ABC transporter ATP-binding protein [Fusibacter bizertensis]